MTQRPSSYTLYGNTVQVYFKVHRIVEADFGNKFKRVHTNSLHISTGWFGVNMVVNMLAEVNHRFWINENTDWDY